MLRRHFTPSEIARLLNEEDEELGSIPNEDSPIQNIDFHVETPLLRNMVVLHNNGNIYRASCFYGNGHILWLGLGYGTQRNRITKSSRPEFYQIKTNQRVTFGLGEIGTVTVTSDKLSEAQLARVKTCFRFKSRIHASLGRPKGDKDLLVTLLMRSYGERISQYIQDTQTRQRNVTLTFQVPASIIAQAFKITFDELLAELSGEDSEWLSVMRKIGAGLEEYILSKDEYDVHLFRSYDGLIVATPVLSPAFRLLDIKLICLEILRAIGPSLYLGFGDFGGVIPQAIHYQHFLDSPGEKIIAKVLSGGLPGAHARRGISQLYTYDLTGPKRIITMNVENVVAVYHA